MNWHTVEVSWMVDHNTTIKEIHLQRRVLGSPLDRGVVVLLIIYLPSNLSMGSPAHRATSSPGHQLTGPPGLPGQRLTGPPGLPGHRLTGPPGLPGHQLTGPPGSQTDRWDWHDINRVQNRRIRKKVLQNEVHPLRLESFVGFRYMQVRKMCCSKRFLGRESHSSLHNG